MSADCYACRLTEGVEPLPGGRIHATEHWVVEHCTGPLGVGTLIVKPFRHCLHVEDFTVAEARELGPLLRRVSQAIQALAQADLAFLGNRLPDKHEKYRRLLGRKDEVNYGARSTTLEEAERLMAELDEFAAWTEGML